MKMILDTHIFLWALAEPGKIPMRKRLEIESAANQVFVSAISIAEIMVKASIGKLDADFDPVEAAGACGFELLDFSGSEALLLGKLPFHHKDPFDRMLIAQSQSTGIPVMTEDARFQLYGCKTI